MGTVQIPVKTKDNGLRGSLPKAEKKPQTPLSLPWRPFSMIEQLTLKRFHPQSLFIEMAGAMWAVYLFWNHDWMLALATVVLYRAIAIASVWNVNPQMLAETMLGKLALLHLHPFNLTIQVVGAIPLLYGVWQHSTEYILAGLSVVFLGHTFGWDKIDQRFSVNQE